MSNSTFKSFETKPLDLLVVDRNGKLTGEARSYSNAAAQWLMPDQCSELVIVNWLFEGAEKPTEVELQKPIQYNSKTYMGWWAWGSAIKRGYTIGMQHDWLRESGIAAKSEDGQRAGRAILPNALYGAGIGTLRVYLAKKGEQINGMPVEDGFGYTRKGIASKVRNTRSEIQLGQVRDSFHMAQRLEWGGALAAETTPLINERLITMSDPLKWLKESHMKADEKLALLEMQPRMALHPYIANGLSRSSQEIAARLATSIPMNGVYRVAVPSTVATVAFDGKVILGRYPMDSNSSERAIEGVNDQAEIDRIAELEVAQYTLVNKNLFAKGDTGIVDDALLVIDGEQYDMALCNEDIKMAVEGVDAIRSKREIVDELYLGFTQVWAKGSAVGIGYSQWAKMGGDFDGDGAVVVDCTERPALWNAVDAMPEGTSYKLPKSRSTWDQGDKRANMLVKSLQCATIVGFATNVAATTFAMQDRKWLARQLGYTTPEALDKVLNHLIKVGTDGFKSDVDTEEAAKRCAHLQSALTKIIGKGAPWCSWNHDTYAFKHAVPAFIGEGKGMTKEDVRIGIPSVMDGTIPQICKITLPSIEAFLTIQIEAKPLSAFTNWAQDVSEELFAEAEKLQLAYNGRVKSTNFSDDNSVGNFVSWWDGAVQAWIEQHPEIGRANLAAALWRVAHSSRSANAGGGSVFTATPLHDEVMAIIAHPGLTRDSRVVLTGLQYNLPANMLKRLECVVKIADFTSQSHGKAVVRKVVITAIKGQKPATGGYPEGTLALVSASGAQPEDGEYMAVIEQATDKTWTCKLEVINKA